MVSHRHAQNFSPRLWTTIAATVIACLVALLASINLYLLEDNNLLTRAAYSASLVLRLSYDGAYLSALVATIAICAIAGYGLIRKTTPVTIGLGIIALLVALAGFGGLLVRQPISFLILFSAFVGLALISFLIGRAVTHALQRLGQRSAVMLGTCVGAGIALLVNVGTLVPHTLILNPVSHPLYMQGQISGTHLNSALIAMALELLTSFIFLLTLLFALRMPEQPA